MKPETTIAQEERLIEMLRGLKGKVPGIVDLSAGRTFIPERGHGHTVGLMVRFNTRAECEAYGPHPEHVLVKEYFAQIGESTTAIDYEF